jgi:hypothetical protein
VYRCKTEFFSNFAILFSIVDVQALQGFQAAQSEQGLPDLRVRFHRSHFKGKNVLFRQCGKFLMLEQPEGVKIGSVGKYKNPLLRRSLFDRFHSLRIQIKAVSELLPELFEGPPVVALNALFDPAEMLAGIIFTGLGIEFQIRSRSIRASTFPKSKTPA